MTEKEFFEKTIEEEIPRFDRVFKALPDEPKDIKAHPKNRNVREIIEVMALESLSVPILLETGEFDFGKDMPTGSKNVSETASMFKKNLEKGRKMALKMSEEDWDEPAKMMMNGKIMWETTKGAAVWSTIFDAIHHRGQISTHIRPQGGKVPSIYGPSGDSM